MKHVVTLETEEVKKAIEAYLDQKMMGRVTIQSDLDEMEFEINLAPKKTEETPDPGHGEV